MLVKVRLIFVGLRNFLLIPLILLIQLLSQNKRPELPGGPNQVASPPPINLSTRSQLSSTSSAESRQRKQIRYQLIMPARFFLLLFFSFTFSFSLSSAIRNRCRPEDAQILSEVFNRPIIDCCRLSDTRCNANTSWIDYLTIKNDVISGRLSPAIGRMTRLQELILVRLPNVYGEIPSEMAKLTGLTNLVISDTNLTGPIPTWLGQLKNLRTLSLSNSRFTGSIPSSLGNLPKLTYLTMEWNQLSGPIPESLGRLPLEGLGLGHNQLSGPVPLSLGRVNFDYIDLNRNRLVGDPSHLFSNRYKSLRRIDLSRNLFDFDLSKAVFPVNLSSMDLSHNMIRGSISFDIVRVPELYYFNVSYNGLCGRIPQGGALQGLPSESFAHNKCLCGPPLSTAC